MAAITRTTRIGAYGHPDGGSYRRFEYADGEATLQAGNDHAAFVGKTFTLRADGKHLLMQGAVVTVITPQSGWIEGFVEIDDSGEAVDDLEGEHTGVFQREMWGW